MAKKFSAIKTTLILAIIIISIFNAYSFAVSARFIRVQPVIALSPEKAENVIPRSGVLDIGVSVSVSLSGLLSTFVQHHQLSLLKDNVIAVRLEATTDQDWVEATMVRSLIEVKVSDLGKDLGEALRTRVQLTVTEKAPAFTLGQIKVTARTDEIRGLGFVIEEKEFVETVPFEIGYWGVLSISSPEGNFKEISPLGSAVFPIEIRNLGNAVTRVLIEPIGEIPSGWVVSVPATDLVQSDDVAGVSGSKTTLFLTIRPPFDFGIHNERAAFQIRFTTHYIGQPHLVGESQTEIFNVQSIGFSPGIGYEVPTIATVLIVLFIGIYYFFYKKRNGVKEEKDQNEVKKEKMTKDLLKEKNLGKPEKKETKGKPEKKETKGKKSKWNISKK